MPEKHLVVPNAAIEPEEPKTPERSLLAAILIRAISDVLNPPQSEGGASSKYNQHNTHLRTAESWFRSKKTKDWGFLWVCEHLCIDAETTRRFIKEAKEKGVRFEPGMNRALEPWEVVMLKKRKKAAHF